VKNFDKMAGRELIGAVQPGIQPFVADPEYLSICLYHLIQNPAKFSPDGLSIQYGADEKDGEVHLWVRDGGRGIPENELENIWQTFYQINRQENEDQGSGAGLAIVRGLVDLHNGRIEVESTVGAGSTFNIILPIVVPPAETKSNGAHA